MLHDWAQYLGLVSSRLFPSHESVPGNPTVLLDGPDSSLICTSGPPIAPDLSRSWRWSSGIPHHLHVGMHVVELHSGDEPEPTTHSRASFDANPTAFLHALSHRAFRPLPDVVDFLRREFQELSRTLHLRQRPKPEAIATFLIGLEAVQSDGETVRSIEQRLIVGQSLGLKEATLEALTLLDPITIQRAATLDDRVPAGLTLIPELVFRHASGRLFHGILRTCENRAEPPVVPEVARLAVDVALRAVSPPRDVLTIADYACGAGLLLSEAVLGLERIAHSGTLVITGRDPSEAAALLTNAAVTTALRGSPTVAVTIDIAPSEPIVSGEWPAADLVLLNPPHRLWHQLSSAEQEWLQNSPGYPLAGKPDLSVGYLLRGLRALRPGGVVAAMIPTGFLGSRRLAAWRKAITAIADALLVSEFAGGSREQQFSLLAFQKRGDSPSATRTSSVDVGRAVDIDSNGELVRALRRTSSGAPPEATPMTTRSVVSTASPLHWRRRPTWSIGPRPQSNAVAQLAAAGHPCMGQLLSARERLHLDGGLALVIDLAVWGELPDAERRYFTPVIDEACLYDGQIQRQRMMFHPSDEWDTEQEVKHAIPTYFQYFLSATKSALAHRKEVTANQWWLPPTSKRTTLGMPRIVARRTGLVPSFALDLAGQLPVIEANHWTLRPHAPEGAGFSSADLLRVYWWIQNSRVMQGIFREFCPTVARGRLDLGPRHLRRVPMPNVAERMTADPGISELVQESISRFGNGLPPMDRRDTIATSLFGLPIQLIRAV